LEVLLSKTGGLATALLFPFGVVAGFFVRQFYLMTLISKLYFYNEHLENAPDQFNRRASILKRLMTNTVSEKAQQESTLMNAKLTGLLKPNNLNHIINRIYF
jgi:hypothetical protein